MQSLDPHPPSVTGIGGAQSPALTMSCPLKLIARPLMLTAPPVALSTLRSLPDRKIPAGVGEAAEGEAVGSADDAGVQSPQRSGHRAWSE